MTWQPIETAPKDGTWVLLYDPSCDISRGGRIGVGSYEDDFGDGSWIFDDTGSIPWEPFPTHWMPLPPKPEQD